MSDNLKIEVVVSDIPENGVMDFSIVTKQQLEIELAKIPKLKDGYMDITYIPTEITRLLNELSEKIEQLSESLITDYQGIRRYCDSYIDSVIKDKADLINGSVPPNQLTGLFLRDNLWEGSNRFVYTIIGNIETANKFKNSVKINGIDFDGSKSIQLSKSNIGLGNVDNTADKDKPISDAVKIVLDNKANAVDVYTKTEVDQKTNISLDGLLSPNTSAVWGSVPEIKKLSGDTSIELNAQAKVLLQMLNDIRKNGGVMPYIQSFADAIGGFDIGDHVKLINGEIVYSTIPDNRNDPNNNMIGWYKSTIKDKERLLLGTNSLYDKHQSGVIDDLVRYSTTPNVDLKNKKIVIPSGSYRTLSDGWFRNRGAPVSTETSGLTDFELIGQGSQLTEISSSSIGAQMFFDYAKNFKMSGFTLDGGGQSNGQFWMRYSEDGEFSDLLFKNGYTLSFAIDNCKNIQANDLKVDGQKVYIVGDGKSPLIVGDFSEQCKIIGGYTKAKSTDGHLYEGDLGDSDDATDTKWAFHNFYGLMFNDLLNSNVCLWQEGERERGNMHGIGNSYVGNGFGRGVSEKSIGTDVACSFNKNQRAGVWARGTQYVSIGNHYLDIKNVQNLPDSNYGAIYNESSVFLASVANSFDGNDRDYSQYSAGQFVAGNGYFSVADSFSSTLFQDPSSTNYPQHNAFIGSRFNEDSEFIAAKNDTFNAFVGSQFVGFAGSFGRGNDANLTNIHSFSNCSFNNKGSNVYAFTAFADVRLIIKDSNFTNYSYICDFSSFRGVLTYENCTFRSCTFSANDLNYSRFINCTFINCINSPYSAGLNFKCDSDIKPSTIRTEVNFVSGGVYTFPAWTHEQCGVYDIAVGGVSDGMPVYKGYIYKTSAVDVATVVSTLESTAGAITVTWAANGYISITATVAGIYSIKLG